MSNEPLPVPEDIKDKIAVGSFDYLKIVGTHERPDITRHDFVKGAEFGYSLAASEIESLNAQVRVYKQLLESGDKIRTHQSKLLSEAKTVDSEREANEILTNQISTLQQDIEIQKAEIERLSAALDKAHAGIKELRRQIDEEPPDDLTHFDNIF